MRAVLFILKLGLKILAAPVVLALTLFTWVCFWAAVCVQLHLRPGLHGGGAAGDRGACDLLAAKRRHPAGDRLPGQPAGPADGRRLAGESKVQDLRYAIQDAVYG